MHFSPPPTHTQTRESLCCKHTHSMDVDEESFYCFFLLKHSDVVFILLINVKIVGISTFMSRINFVLR